MPDEVSVVFRILLDQLIHRMPIPVIVGSQNVFQLVLSARSCDWSKDWGWGNVSNKASQANVPTKVHENIIAIIANRLISHSYD